MAPSLSLGPPRLLKSAGFRFALLFAAMFASAAIALVAVLWWATAGALDRQTDAAVRADAIALAERWREAGATGLAEAIEERLAVDVENEAIYLLTEAEGGRRLAGNLDRWPAVPAEEGAWFRTRVLHDGFAAEARLHRLELPGLRLLVGRDESEREQLRRLLTEGVFWASGAVVLFALMGAWLLRHALQARMRPVFATTAAIAGGNLGSRVALSGRGDEFDRLAQTLNTMLERIGTLMEGSAASPTPSPTTSAPRSPGPGPSWRTRSPRRRTSRRCGRRWSRASPTSMPSAASSRPCCGSPRPRRGRGGPPSPRSTSAWCWPTRPRSTRWRPRRAASTSPPTCRRSWSWSATATCCCRPSSTCWTTRSSSPRPAARCS
ncbi:HAMP domain-containing protein [Paeniroseomonas aquatica]|uniref:HAMP domain-containing protein n=1 Tax=Paeniroseomonas aquatica TaxID=373043 RepID=UPI0036204C57